MLMIETAISTRNNRSGFLRRILSTYLRSCGTSARAFDSLTRLGVTMSRTWTYEAIKKIAKAQMVALRESVHQHRFIGLHDNIDLPMQLYREQRLDNTQEFPGGTVGAVIQIRDESIPRVSARNYLAKRSSGVQRPISTLAIIDREVHAGPKLALFERHFILSALLDAPEFDLVTYANRDDLLLQPPPSLDQLPTGPEHRTEWYLLQAVNTGEASIADNFKVLNLFLEQLGFGSDELRRRLATQVVPWTGDQLTIARLRSLQELLAFEPTDFHRFGWLVHLIVFLHTQMAHAKSLHSQYYLSDIDLGFAHAFNILKRKNLATKSTKGPFHHNLELTIYDILTARMRDAWLRAIGSKSLSDARNLSASELCAMAVRIHETLASTSALRHLDALAPNQQDAVLRQNVQINRDLLEYVTFDSAIKRGDVGVMEAMIPRLLFRFIGGKNSNYAKEMLELLQGLENEWPEDLK